MAHWREGGTRTISNEYCQHKLIFANAVGDCKRVGVVSRTLRTQADFNRALMNLNRKEAEKRFTSLDQQNIQSNAQQARALEQIRQGIDSTQQKIDIGHTLLKQISNTPQLDWLRQMGSELKGLMHRVIAMNIATYHAVISIQAALSSRIERPLIEEPFTLEDPIGRVFPVHLKFVTSWEAFHAIMEIHFSNVQGLKKMRERQYGLQEGSTGREIKQTKPWQRAFLPGQRVEMAFIFQTFQTEIVKDADAANMTCPGCQTPSKDVRDTEVQCHSCQMWFRRITEVGETEQSYNKTEVNDSVPSSRKRAPSEDEEEQDDIRDFKRVRLLQTIGSDVFADMMFRFLDNYEKKKRKACEALEGRAAELRSTQTQFAETVRLQSSNAGASLAPPSVSYPPQGVRPFQIPPFWPFQNPDVRPFSYPGSAPPDFQKSLPGVESPFHGYNMITPEFLKTPPGWSFMSSLKMSPCDLSPSEGQKEMGHLCHEQDVSHE